MTLITQGLTTGKDKFPLQDNNTTHRTPTLKSHTDLSTFVPAYPQKRELARVEMAAPIIDIASRSTPHQPHRNDDAITHAAATLMVSVAHIVASAMIVAGLVLLAWVFRAMGNDAAPYAFTGLLAWGICTLTALWGNRKQSLRHTPIGLARHEVESKERLAKHAIDVHAHLLVTRWKMDRDNER